jgi:N-acylglucosamine 2-epimerase
MASVPSPSAPDGAVTTASATATVEGWLGELRADLFGRTLPFWLTHSPDGEHGGFFNCLDSDGAVFDASKHVWLQGRQCWTLAKIANALGDSGLAARAAAVPPPRPPTAAAGRSKAAATPVPMTRDGMVGAARRGVQFLRDFAVRRTDGQVYFSLSRDGGALAMQRKPFAATFLIMALTEVGAATGEAELQGEARALLEEVLRWVNTPGALREVMPGACVGGGGG